MVVFAFFLGSVSDYAVPFVINVVGVDAIITIAHISTSVCNILSHNMFTASLGSISLSNVIVCLYWLQISFNLLTLAVTSLSLIS